jgi:DNA-3-methyladenine glycosylase
MRKILAQKFFDRDTHEIAPELIGNFLVRKIGKREMAVMITEVEVYDGFEDKASHASRGQTERTAVMFGHPGVWYVYLVYGMHEMLNIVTREHSYPAAILIRGARVGERIIDGPGKITKYLKINRTQNKKKAEKKSDLWIEDRGIKIAPHDIEKTPRIGIHYAGPIWAKKKWRYILRK